MRFPASKENEMATSKGLSSAHQTATRKAPARRRKRSRGRLRTHAREETAAANGAVNKLGRLHNGVVHRIERGRPEIHRADGAVQQLVRRQPGRTLLIGAGIVALAGVGVALGAYWMRSR